MQGDASTVLVPKNNDTIASLDGARSVGDNNDAETVGTNHNNDGPENVLELLCALT